MFFEWMVLCGTKNSSSMASLWRTFWSTFIFKSVSVDKFRGKQERRDSKSQTGHWENVCGQRRAPDVNALRPDWNVAPRWRLESSALC